MSMYLPNPDLNSTGYEPGEFIESPSTASDAGRDRAPIEQPEGPTVPLDRQSLLNITRWAEEYISGLVENHHGGPEDVRSVIHQLHDQMAPADDWNS
jgi:hypothetical protein